MNALEQIITIIRKDLLTEMRSKDVIISMFVFTLIILAVFNFVFDPGKSLQELVPGIFWSAVLFAGNLGLSRSFAREHENAHMQGLILCPVDRSAIYVAKAVGNIIFMLVVQLLTLPIMMLFYDVQLGNNLLPFILVIFLGTAGFAGIGTLFSTISANTKSREVMLPILLFPVSVPIILSVVKSTAAFINGKGWPDAASWIQLLIVFDIIFIMASFILYEYILEE